MVFGTRYFTSGNGPSWYDTFYFTSGNGHSWYDTTFYFTSGNGALYVRLHVMANWVFCAYIQLKYNLAVHGTQFKRHLKA